MNNPYIVRSNKPTKKSCTNLASCAAAAVFLLLAISTITILYFLLFKPTPPKISVDAVQFPTFSTANATVSFTYFQYVTVTNPNRDIFTHFDSSLELVSGGENVGLVFIPAGKIYAGRVQHMAAKFVVDAYPIAPSGASRVYEVVGGGRGGNGVGSTMQIETRMKLVGRVKVLKVFTHKVESRIKCGVAVEIHHGTVLGFHC